MCINSIFLKITSLIRNGNVGGLSWWFNREKLEDLQSFKRITTQQQQGLPALWGQNVKYFLARNSKISCNMRWNQKNLLTSAHILIIFVDLTIFVFLQHTCFLDPDGDSNRLVESCQTLRSLTGPYIIQYFVPRKKEESYHFFCHVMIRILTHKQPAAFLVGRLSGFFATLDEMSATSVEITTVTVGLVLSPGLRCILITI